MDTRTINDVHTNYCTILTNPSITGHTSKKSEKNLQIYLDLDPQVLNFQTLYSDLYKYCR